MRKIRWGRKATENREERRKRRRWRWETLIPAMMFEGENDPLDGWRVGEEVGKLRPGFPFLYHESAKKKYEKGKLRLDVKRNPDRPYTCKRLQSVNLTAR